MTERLNEESKLSANDQSEKQDVILSEQISKAELKNRSVMQNKGIKSAVLASLSFEIP
jgi:hypothetical protein